MEDVMLSFDEWGPAKVIRVHAPNVGLDGVLVVDNVAAGPAIGGLRMAPDVSAREAARLARTMTLKNAAAGIPHGGAKSVIAADPKLPVAQKEALVRAFACALRGERGYIFGPDMGTNEMVMGWVKDELGRAVGLPTELGGIPVDELGATGWGVRHAAEVAASFCGVKLVGARLAVQGFGAVGKHAARFLAERGAMLVAASDSSCTLHEAGGLDVAKLIAFKNSGGEFADYPAGDKLGRDAVVGLDCDIWIPAARPDVIREDNADQLKARLVIEGANIPITEGAEKILHQRGVLCVPDIIANAGGVICAAMEYSGASTAAAFAAIEEKLRANTENTLKEARKSNIMPREAANLFARRRLEKAMSCRRWGVF
ncbi:MAG: Glu/Leu/Phe/Val family dehydrogenase [Thiobacillaceae bacterium]